MLGWRSFVSFWFFCPVQKTIRAQHWPHLSGSLDCYRRVTFKLPFDHSRPHLLLLLLSYSDDYSLLTGFTCCLPLSPSPAPFASSPIYNRLLVLDTYTHTSIIEFRLLLIFITFLFQFFVCFSHRYISRPIHAWPLFRGSPWMIQSFFLPSNNEFSLFDFEKQNKTDNQFRLVQLDYETQF